MQLCIALPIQPGKTRALGEDTNGFKMGGNTVLPKEVQGSEGDMVPAHFASLIREFAASTHPFDVWFRQKLQESTGVDFSKFEPSMLPELLLQYGY